MVDQTYLNALRIPSMKWNVNSLTYYFVPNGTPNWFSDQDWRPFEKTAFRKAFDAWSDVADISFRQVYNPGANFNERLKHTLPGNAAGLHTMPEEGGYNAAGKTAGRYWVLWDAWNKDGLVPSGLGFQSILHEIGHGLGLAHPFQYDVPVSVVRVFGTNGCVN